MDALSRSIERKKSTFKGGGGRAGCTWSLTRIIMHGSSLKVKYINCLLANQSARQMEEDESPDHTIRERAKQFFLCVGLAEQENWGWQAVRQHWKYCKQRTSTKPIGRSLYCRAQSNMNCALITMLNAVLLLLALSGGFTPSPEIKLEVEAIKRWTA